MQFLKIFLRYFKNVVIFDHAPKLFDIFITQCIPLQRYNRFFVPHRKRLVFVTNWISLSYRIKNWSAIEPPSLKSIVSWLRIAKLHRLTWQMVTFYIGLQQLWKIWQFPFTPPLAINKERQQIMFRIQHPTWRIHSD